MSAGLPGQLAARTTRSALGVLPWPVRLDERCGVHMLERSRILPDTLTPLMLAGGGTTVGRVLRGVHPSHGLPGEGAGARRVFPTGGGPRCANQSSVVERGDALPRDARRPARQGLYDALFEARRVAGGPGAGRQHFASHAAHARGGSPANRKHLCSSDCSARTRSKWSAGGRRGDRPSRQRIRHLSGCAAGRGRSRILQQRGRARPACVASTPSLPLPRPCSMLPSLYFVHLLSRDAVDQRSGRTHRRFRGRCSRSSGTTGCWSSSFSRTERVT